MKQIFIYGFLFSLIFSMGTNSIQAQKIESYQLVMPKHYLSEGSPIYIEAPKDTEGKNTSFGEKYAKTLKGAFDFGNRGMQSGVKNFNPWYTTNIYQLTENEAEAKYVIGGEFTISSSTFENAKSHQAAETSSSGNPAIPYHYYEYSAGANASVKGKLTVFDKTADKVIMELPFDKTESSSKSAYLNPVNVPAASQFVSKAEDAAVNQQAYYFIPYFTTIQYKFENIKSNDKDYNKELRKSRGDLKDLADAGKVNELGKEYLAMVGKDLKDPEDVHLNIGYCYELIGNFTKAKEHYDKSGDSESIKRIDLLILYRDIYKKLGVKVVENEF